MSDIEQVQSFNPLLIVVWVMEIIIVAMDYSSDQRISWSIPVIGSFLIIQLYMLWKTNHDNMIQEQRKFRALKIGGSLVENTPLIQPGKTNLQNASSRNSVIVDLTLAPSLIEDDQQE